jgi:RNA recognition motif-containing protein
MFFSKVGIIELDPETQRPKIKLYRHKEGAEAGKPKGDASICYARPESVELALQLLDEAPYRPSSIQLEDESLPIRVSRAKFEQHGTKFETKAPVSNAKRKVAKLAAIQAIGWDEGDNGRITGGRKGLRIIVLKHMFQVSDLNEDEDAVLRKLEHDVRTECEQWGVVEKITVFSKHAEGIIIIKFTQPTAASTAVTEFDGRELNGRRIEAIFWDGVTDYTVRNEEKEKEESEIRQEEFGKWLESQELPEEFRLQVEGTSS